MTQNMNTNLPIPAAGSVRVQAVNMNSAKMIKAQVELVMQGMSPAEAYKQVNAGALVELELKSVKAQVKAQVFAIAIENGTKILAPAEVIKAVELDYRAKRLAGEGSRMASLLAMKMARAWVKAGFTYGQCYASNESIEVLKKTYNIA